MNIIQGTSSVFRFEWKRSLTLKRGIWWILLTAFPPALMLLIVATGGRPPSNEPVSIVTYILCPGVVSILGVFLWATPWLSSELEGRSWVYLAVRPGGARAVLFGKYLAAVTWTIPAGLIASTLCVLILASSDWLSLIWIQWRLVVLSCCSYGAVFALIGTLFPKRAMVVGVFFTVLFEVVMALIPAAVNLLTVQFRLRCLFVRWLDWDASILPRRDVVFVAYFGDQSAAWHLGILIAMTLGLLAAAAILVNTREFTAETESDV